MTRATIKRVGTILFFAESLWSVILYIQSLFTGSLKVIGSVEIHPPIFLLLVILGFGIIIAINYEWILKKLPSQKFRAYSPIIDECLKKATQQCGMTIIYENSLVQQLSPHIYSAFTGLSLELKYLCVKCPAINKNDENYLSVWFEYLVKLAPYAKHGDLRRARKINIPSESDK